jgi:UDP-N-acetylmuramoyl-tripeptide--D-alanyl-D-alanine ligase
MKQIKITIEDLFDLPGAIIYNPDKYQPVSAVTIDSRKIPLNALFVAIKGKKFDGHNFVKDVIKKGIKAVVINKSQLNKIGDLKVPLITVPDTTIALGTIAGAWRQKLNSKIIALTGSAGKTSTKDILVQLLSEKFSVNKTVANNNNHIGVPLTILSTNSKFDVLVVEMGTNHFGEIQYSADIVKPDYALITNIGDSHLEYFKNQDGVFKEKSALLKVTESRKGMIFINNDDTYLRKYGAKLKNKVTFAFNNYAIVKGKIIGLTGEGKTEILIKYARKTFKLSVPLYGEQNAKNVLAAVTIALKMGLTQKEIESGTKKLVPADKRLNVKKDAGYMLIDDTYNANPESMKASLELLGKISAYKQRIAVLGDMFELGKEDIKLHRNLASVIKKNKIDSLFTIGRRMKHLNETLIKSGIEMKHFSSRKSLKDFLETKDITNSVILVKGSRGMKMEEFVQTIKGRKG